MACICADFLAVNHGSIVTLTPLTESAQEWVDEHLPEDVQRFGRGIAIEPRYWGPIQDGILGDGLSFV